MDKIKINSQYLKHLRFDIFDTPKIFFLENSLKPNIDISVKVEACKYNEEVYELVLKIIAKSTVSKDDQYELEIHYAALCNIITKCTEKDLVKELMVNIPTLIFPSARSIISGITRDANLASLMLSPIDFLETYNLKS